MPSSIAPQVAILWLEAAGRAGKAERAAAAAAEQRTFGVHVTAGATVHAGAF
jgi:hypothetical protein